MDISIVKRLAFIKYIFELGNAQSKLPEPVNSASVLMFHDSVELFLQLTCEYLDFNIGKSQINFIDYWDVISPKLKSGFLPQKESMKRLNKSRVALKHHGTLPSKLDIESFRALTASFFAESTPLIFLVEFKDISLIDFVAEEDARSFLHEAEILLSNDDLRAASEKVALAFRLLIDDYEFRKQSQYEKSPFYFGKDFTFLDKHSMGLGYGSRPMFAREDFQRKLGDFIDRVTESLEAMQSAIRIIAMGIDYPKYSKFLLLTPGVYRTGEGKYHADGGKNVASKEDIQFCINFVIETALKLQEFDYTLE